MTSKPAAKDYNIFIAVFLWFLNQYGSLTPVFMIGKYLGPTIDVGLAMTAKILQHNGEVFRSMYQPLRIEEMADAQIPYDIHSFKKLLRNAYVQSSHMANTKK